MDSRLNVISIARHLVLIGATLTSSAWAQTLTEPIHGIVDGEHQLAWYDLTLLNIEGQGWRETKLPFDRLPAKAEAIVRPEVWRLSRQSSGICVRFFTAATTIHARWTLTLDTLSEPAMPATAVSGLDLYVKHNDRWRWFAVGKPERQTNEVKLVNNISADEREYLLYLPLYNVPSTIELGLPIGSRMLKAAPAHARVKPVVFYGTSITQGGCASRPGMVYTAILGRRLDRPVINLGFRANGTLDLEMVPLFAELDPAVYVLDCLPNMTGPDVSARTEPFIKALRAARPETPIVLAEDRSYPDGILYPARRERNQLNRAALKAAFDRLEQAGIKHLSYLEGEDLLGDDGDATVDASHPTDLGHHRLADKFEKVLRPLLTIETPSKPQ
ncbi:SGNH/GDSL hydrolase family protein [Schlesneria paludicola]|uniref:SGNH/GDSL hydrolase family protein n=1 Tax=Schlesneria paludicola TaxID=360056 RepID=UPI00029B0045|nr:SGNH/GDSL hydrolase family protein [Schlesneria paludicola]